MAQTTLILYGCHVIWLKDRLYRCSWPSAAPGTPSCSGSQHRCWRCCCCRRRRCCCCCRRLLLLLLPLLALPPMLLLELFTTLVCTSATSHAGVLPTLTSLDMCCRSWKQSWMRHCCTGINGLPDQELCGTLCFSSGSGGASSRMRPPVNFGPRCIMRMPVPAWHNRGGRHAVRGQPGQPAPTHPRPRRPRHGGGAQVTSPPADLLCRITPHEIEAALSKISDQWLSPLRFATGCAPRSSRPPVLVVLLYG